MIPSVEQIRFAVTRETGVFPVSNSRAKRFVRAKYLFAILLRDIRQMSYPEIAAEVGVRNHSSVIEGVRLARLIGATVAKRLRDRLEIEAEAEEVLGEAGMRAVRKRVADRVIAGMRQPTPLNHPPPADESPE